MFYTFDCHISINSQPTNQPTNNTWSPICSMALVLARTSSARSSGDHPVVPPPPPPDPLAFRKSRRRIDLNKYCRQFLHFSRCRYETKCKYIHIAFCRWYVTGGCTKMDCPLLHVDICENWRRGGEKCKFLPSCKYLHAGPQRHRDSTLPAFPSRPNSDLCLGRPVFHGAQPLVTPLAIADADDEDGVETLLR